MSTDAPTYRAPIPGRYEIRPLILRAYRSKYAPHVGKKQMTKQAAWKEKAFALFDEWSQTPNS